MDPPQPNLKLQTRMNETDGSELGGRTDELGVSRDEVKGKANLAL